MAGPSHPRHFTDEFKHQIVELYNSGKPPVEIQRENDLCRSTLRRRVNSINATGSPHTADSRAPEQGRINELEGDVVAAYEASRGRCGARRIKDALEARLHELRRVQGSGIDPRESVQVGVANPSELE